MRSSGSRRSMLARVLATSLLALCGGAGSAHATVYKWVDSSGIAHYTTDPAEVPSSLRGQIPSARSGETGDLERIPPPQGEAGRNLLSAIPAPRMRRREAPASAPDPELGRQAPATQPEPSTDSEDARLRAIPPPRHPAERPLDPDSIPAPRAAPEGPRALAEPAPFAPEARPEGSGDGAGAAPPETPTPRARPSDARAAELEGTGDPGASRIGSVDSAPPFDPDFDDPPRAESPEIADLERQIEADRSALKRMLTTARSSGAPLSDDPELRAISERLPLLQARLAALRAQLGR
ncbi:MAG: DUF4124 domain-containing protein [Myxococcota bacterium]